MKLENEVALNGTVYCFEDSDRAAEAEKWVASNVADNSAFRASFPDASPVNLRPFGGGPGS